MGLFAPGINAENLSQRLLAAAGNWATPNAFASGQAGRSKRESEAGGRSQQGNQLCGERMNALFCLP